LPPASPDPPKMAPRGAPLGGGSRRAVLSVGRAATRGPPGGYPPRRDPPTPPQAPRAPHKTPPGPPRAPPPPPPPRAPGAFHLLTPNGLGCSLVLPAWGARGGLCGAQGGLWGGPGDPPGGVPPGGGPGGAPPPRQKGTKGEPPPRDFALGIVH
jgi:hypothetical protein